jgi:hypothetical protein
MKCMELLKSWNRGIVWIVISPPLWEGVGGRPLYVAADLQSAASVKLGFVILYRITNTERCSSEYVFSFFRVFAKKTPPFEA